MAFFCLRLLELHFAKTQENVRFENEVCPFFDFASLKCVVQGFNLNSAPSVEPPPLAGLKDRSDSGVAEGD